MKNAAKFSAGCILAVVLVLQTSVLSCRENQQETHGDTPNREGAESGPDQVLLFLAPSTVREIQATLNRLGFDAGNVDGVWREEASKSLANFQRYTGLEPTGTVNLKTLQALGLLPFCQPCTPSPPAPSP